MQSSWNPKPFDSLVVGWEEVVIRLRDYKEDFMATFVSYRNNQKP